LRKRPRPSPRGHICRIFPTAKSSGATAAKAAMMAAMTDTMATVTMAVVALEAVVVA
jgi:hypothetical protein